MDKGRPHLKPPSVAFTPTGGVEGHFKGGWTVQQVRAALRQLCVSRWEKDIRNGVCRLHAPER